MAVMSRRIYYNVPCILFRDFLKSDMHNERVLADVLYYAVYVEYLRLQDKESDEAKRFSMACYNMGCSDQSISNSYDYAIERGELLYTSGMGEAFCSIDNEKYWRMVNDNPTTEEKALFLAWIALKSIIGNKPYIKTNNALWLSRMDGSSTIKSRPYKKKTIYSEEIEKYNSLYRCRRLRALLFDYYHVSFFSDGVRGFYFSLTLGMEELIRAVKQRPKTDAIGKFNDAKKKALEALNHDCNHDFNHDFNHNCNLK